MYVETIPNRGSRPTILIREAWREGKCIRRRIVDPGSKLATAQKLGSETLSSSLGEVLGVQGADADELYGALDWLHRGQARIEAKLARRHLQAGDRVLWDATKLPFESRTCELAAFGRPGAKTKSQRQVLIGLLASPAGVPVAVEVFRGNTSDAKTVGLHSIGYRSASGL